MAATTESQLVFRTSAEKIENCRFVEGQNAVELVIRRAGLIITITVPREIEEWYVDVEDPGTGLKARDWYDYAGYESVGNKDFDRDMAEDLKSFIENLVGRPLRMRDANTRKSRGVLEWQLDGTWTGAVPADVGSAG
jgi:hypothetical protein